MKISVITPTANRDYSLSLLNEWMRRQTVQPHEWIVVDGSFSKNSYSPTHEKAISIRTHPHPDGGTNFRNNLREGLRAATGDVILIMEDDEKYSNDHIERTLFGLEGHDVVVNTALRYYNIRSLWYKEGCSPSLCRVGFTKRMGWSMLQAIERCERLVSTSVDFEFVDATHPNKIHVPTTVSMKGMYANGLTIAHTEKPRFGVSYDPDLRVLRSWINDDVFYYDGFIGAAR